MSDGHAKKPGAEAPLVITMTTEEFGEVCRRIHKFLLDRADKTKAKRDARPTKRANENHIETAKDVFAFVHLMQMVEEMTQEIHDLRSMVSSMADGDEGEESEFTTLPEMFTTRKKHYLN